MKQYSLFRHTDVQLLEKSQPADAPKIYLTPNLDHLRLLEYSASFRRAYSMADIIVNDSRLLDKLFLRGTVLCFPGADWVPAFLERQQRNSRIAVIGFTDEVRDNMQRLYGQRFELDFIQPTMGYVRKRTERRQIVAKLIEKPTDLILLCTGAPQSEVFAAQIKAAIEYPTNIICCGATFHFITKAKQRAPKLMQAIGSEWLWRFINEPHTRRRYMMDMVFLAKNIVNFIMWRTRGTLCFKNYSLRN